MEEEIEKTEQKPKRGGRGNLPSEFIGRPGPGRPRGKRNFETDFKLACEEVAKALRLGEKPDEVQVRLIVTGIKRGLLGNYSFWQDIMNRVYGRPKESLDLTSGGKPIPILSNVSRDNNTQKDSEPQKED